ncbi:Hypothetical predicted protein [Olea europaea subsp. europaea]|uniref:Uncharacterized protein n=1 Tax=Olea europaea subsp. europaea TaxID=158383 RepID=A0A8S0QUE6_OLEEU|nr:Hypothetical predicted protein [Olea europaea subsp. europaea]
MWLIGGDGGEMRVGSCFGSAAFGFGGCEGGGSDGRDGGGDGEAVLFAMFEIRKLAVTGCWLETVVVVVLVAAFEMTVLPRDGGGGFGGGSFVGDVAGGSHKCWWWS